MWAEHLEKEYVECRRFGHQWQIEGRMTVIGAKAVDLRCGRCTAEKLALTFKAGSRENWYWYPEGYMKPDGEPRATTDELTDIVIKRTTKVNQTEKVKRRAANRRR